MNEESKVLEPIIGEPVKANAIPSPTEDPILIQFSDEPIKQPTKEEEKEAKKFLKDVQEYIQSETFVKDCNAKAMKTGQSPRKVATTYIGKVAGIIGDGLGIAVDTVNIGAVGLIIVQVIPFIFNGVLGASVSFGGTSLIIVVGVVLETLKQIESKMLVRNYKGFLNSGK